MRQPIGEDQVEETFGAVFKCLERCREVHSLWAAVYADDDVRGRLAGSKPAREKVAALVGAMRELRAVHERLAKQLQPFAWELPALSDGAIQNSGVTASSWTEGVVKLGESLTRELRDWERVADFAEKPRKDLVNRLALLTPEFGESPDFDLFLASVRGEAARMLKRARAMSPEVRYAYEFLHLKPQSRRFFKLLTERSGRPVEFQTIAAVVLDAPNAPNSRIHKAMSRLKEELNGLGSTDVAERIESESGAYRLR